MSRRTILDCTRLAVAGTPAAIGVFDQKQWERLCNQYMSDSAKKSCLQRAKAQEDEYARLQRAKAQEDEYAREQEGRADRIYNAVKDVGREQGRLDVKDRQRIAMADLQGIVANLKGIAEIDRNELAKKLHAAILALDHAYWASP